MNNKIVTWSGGCDSTLVLHNILKENVSQIQNANITVLSFNSTLLNKKQIEIQKECRLKIKDEFKARDLITDNYNIFNHNNYWWIFYI